MGALLGGLVGAGVARAGCYGAAPYLACLVKDTKRSVLQSIVRSECIWRERALLRTATKKGQSIEATGYPLVGWRFWRVAVARAWCGRSGDSACEKESGGSAARAKRIEPEGGGAWGATWLSLLIYFSLRYLAGLEMSWMDGGEGGGRLRLGCLLSQNRKFASASCNPSEFYRKRATSGR